MSADKFIIFQLIQRKRKLNCDKIKGALACSNMGWACASYIKYIHATILHNACFNLLIPSVCPLSKLVPLVAGGLGVYLHADFIKTLIVDTAKYRAFPDAGYVV